MKKHALLLALMCQMALNGNAQIYPRDTYMRYPTVDLYDPAIMNMTMRAYAETMERRSALFDQYAQLAADAFNSRRWSDAIKYSTSALSLFENGQQYYIRGYAREALGFLKEAKKDYKAGKKHGYPDAAWALDAVNEKIKTKRRRK